MVSIFSRAARRWSRWGSVAVCGLLLMTLVWGIAGGKGAIAAPNETLQDKAESVVDSIAPGTAKQVEGRIQQSMGSAQRTLGDGSDEAEGMAKQAAGSVKKNIGRTQTATENLREEVQGESEGFVDSIKNFFD